MATQWPVVEVFGPTIQGEGAEAGLPCHFVRLGGCDYRCSWCDSMYAVEPAEVRKAERLGTEQIIERLRGLGGAPGWVVLSGGNPALHELGPLVNVLHSMGYAVAVETQGSVWRPWLLHVDRLTVSPKTPSSGMATGPHVAKFDTFMAMSSEMPDEQLVLKFVIADEEDLAWAQSVAGAYPQYAAFLSSLTTQAYPHRDEDEDLKLEVGAQYAWLCEQVAKDPTLSRFRALPQLHVIAWGAARGV